MNLSYALDLFVASLTVIIITGLAWRRRGLPGGGSLTALGASMTVWTMAYAFYWFFSDPHLRLIFFNLMYVGVVGVPVAFLYFSFYYTNRSRGFTRWIMIIISIIPVLTIIAIWTDPLHGWFYGSGGPENLSIRSGVWFWINLAYSYLITVFALASLVQALFTTIPPLRRQLSIIIIGAIVPVVINICMLLGFHPLPGLDLTPFGFVISCVCLAIALSRYRLLDLIPIARSLIIDQMTDGFLVLDGQNRIVDLNRKTEEMLGKSSRELVGMHAEQVFAKFTGLFEQFRDTLTLQQEIRIQSNPPTYLDLHISPLYDRKGKFSGRLIVARDITDRKEAEQAEHEQRILAEALRDSSAALNQSRSFEEVLDRILDNVGRVVPFDLATILLAEDEQKARLVRERGFRENGLEKYLNGVSFTYENLPNLKRMIEKGTSVVISDTSKKPEWTSLEGLEGLRSYVGSPIRIRDLIIGFLQLNSFTPGFFTKNHAERLQAFADQAAIAIENARLLEDAQQRAEEMSALLDIGLAATSGLEMNTLLQALLEKCKKILPIEAFYVATYDNETGIVQYPLFYDQGETIKVPEHEIGTSPGLTGHVIQTGQVLNLTDTQSEETARKFNMIEIGGEPTRSYVAVPLLVGDRVVGVMSMQSSRPNAYQPAQVRLLETMATQAAGAIENARLFEQIRKHAEEMTALFDIGITLTSGLEMEQVLKALLQKCQQVLPVEAFYTGILDPDTGLIHHPLAYDMGEYLQIPSRDLRENPGLSGHIITTRQTLYIPDLLSPDAIKTFQVFRTSGTPTRAWVGVPMIVGDRVVGLISMQSYKPNAYDHSQIRLLETIAMQAAVAIENSRLYAKAWQEIIERGKTERRYRALFEQSHDAVFIIGFDGKYLDANQRASEMLGYSIKEICSLRINEISAQPAESEHIHERLMRGEHIPLYERKFRKKNGKKVDVEINVELVSDSDGTPLHIQSVVREITERKRNERTQRNANMKLHLQLIENKKLQTQLQEQVIRDPLTDLFNRRYLEVSLDREFAFAKRHGTTVCLMMMDIDGFKKFNDTYGHNAGDYLLKEMGRLLRKEFRSSDISCRYGGEEFLVVMPGVSLQLGHRRAERLRKKFHAGKFSYKGVLLEATLSLGVAVYPDNGGTWEEVLHAADQAMYLAKAAGRDKTRSARD